MKQAIQNLALRADSVNYPQGSSPKRIYLNSEEEVQKAVERGFSPLYDEVELPDGSRVPRVFLAVDFDTLLDCLNSHVVL